MATNKRRSAKENAINGAKALSDLHMFAAVQCLMEHSLVSSRRFRSEARIVQICKAEQARCLRDYDRAVAKAILSSDGR